jgi:hypothetical protein
MKKIYLIDDSTIEGIDTGFLEDGTFSDILIPIRNIQSYALNENNMNNSACILVHNTFNSSLITREKVKDITDDGDKIPLVIFSGEDNEKAVFGENPETSILHIKKQLFYTRLKDFLEKYKQSELIELKIIAFGKNFRTEEVIDWATSVLGKFNGRTDYIKTSDLPSINCEEFRKLYKAASPAIAISYEDLMEDLEDSHMALEVFRKKVKKIIKSFNQHGKNIYPWN